MERRAGLQGLEPGYRGHSSDDKRYLTPDLFGDQPIREDYPVPQVELLNGYGTL
jgi:hypothetical protein